MTTGFIEANETAKENIRLREALSKARRDNEEMARNLAAVQERCNELVNASPQRTVGAFMVMSDQLVRTTPQVPDDDEVRLRLRLIAEEFFELIEASVRVDGLGIKSTFVRAEEDLAMTINLADIKVDLPEFADALADLRYVIHGTDLAFGIDGRKIDAEVHRSNISKRGAGKDAAGKIGKGPNYSPPQIAEELRRQGWRS